MVDSAPVPETPQPQIQAPRINTDQPSEVRNYLKELVTNNLYNKYCIDCNERESEYCCVTVGIFLCEECAKVHKEVLTRQDSYIKSCEMEHWDEFQLRCVQPGIGGN